MTEDAFSTIAIVLAITCAGFVFVLYVTLQAVKISRESNVYGGWDDDGDD